MAIQLKPAAWKIPVGLCYARYMTSSTSAYSDNYRDIDFRAHPEKYRVGRGEQGVLIAEPYKSEILPNWKFATPEAAEKSARHIYQQFLDYKKAGDFVGMDMARKFLQMGFTRSRRYANHAGGHKYDGSGDVRPQDTGSENSDKARSAKIFYGYYRKARDDTTYQRMRAEHKASYEPHYKP